MKRAGGGSGSDDEEEDVHHTTASDILSFMPVIWPRRFPYRRQLRIWQIHSDEVSLYTHPRTQQMLRKVGRFRNTGHGNLLLLRTRISVGLFNKLTAGWTTATALDQYPPTTP